MTNETTTPRPGAENTGEDLKGTLESVEQQVKETVQTTVAAAGDTVQTVKEAVQGTVETVTDSVKETVASVKRTFDLSYQVEQHPWAMLAGAAAVGFVAERLLTWASTPRVPTPAVAPVASAPPPPPRPAVPKKPGFFSRLTATFGEQLAKLKELAVTAAAGPLQEAVAAAAPEPLRHPLDEVVTGVTTKLGGRPTPVVPGMH